MVYGLVLVIHVLVALFLIGVVLLQCGRGGLGEALGGAAVRSLFGGGANTVMAKLTAVVAGIFMVTCLSLAMLSTARGRSVIDQLPLVSPEQLPAVLPNTGAPPAAPAATPSQTSEGSSPQTTTAASQPQQPPAPNDAPSSAPPTSQ